MKKVFLKSNGKRYAKSTEAVTIAPPVTVIQKQATNRCVKDLVPDILAWAMKNPQKRAFIKKAYARFNSLLSVPLSYAKFRSRCEICKLTTRFVELRQGSASTARSAEIIGKNMVDDFIAERRRRGIEHVKKMFHAVDKIHEVFDTVNPTEKTLSSFTQQAKQIDDLGKSVFALDKDQQVVAPNQLNIAVLIKQGKEEDDDDDVIDV